MTDTNVLIVGAGLTGLNAAHACQRAGIETVLVEGSDGPGGRVRTDVVDGYRLDRGFQILLTAYPEARVALDYDALDLRAFNPGAKIRKGATFHTLGDPLRRPRDLPATVRAPIGTLRDKLAILGFRRQVGRAPLPDIWTAPPTTARQRLADLGFSDAMVEDFFSPLFGGITLDPDLAGTSRVLDFVFKMMSAGDAVVPANGMGAISDQLAAGLGAVDVRYDSAVSSLDGTTAQLADGSTIRAERVIIATDMSAAATLSGVVDRGWKGVTSVWFGADVAPERGPTLLLNADGGTVNSVAVMSEVSPSYAPPGRSLIVASAPSTDAGVAEAITADLRGWFGGVVDTWDTLRVDRIEHAQPKQAPGDAAGGVVQVAENVVVAGDFRQDASINGALRSGAQAAHAILPLRR